MSTELVVVSGADVPALVREIDRAIAFIDRCPDAKLIDIARTCAITEGEERLALVVENLIDLRNRLYNARTRLATGGIRRLRDKSGTYYFKDRLLGEGRGKLAFIYPGVASFYPDMMRDLAIFDPSFRSAFDELEEALAGDLEFNPSNFIFPPADCYRRDAEIFSSGAYAQSLVSTYTGGIAMTRLLKSSGIVPDGVTGFAGGDLAALVRSGVAGDNPPRPERVRIIREIYRIVDRAVDHSGLPEVVNIAVLLRHDEDAVNLLDGVLKSFPAGKVLLSLDLSPRQKTYAIIPDFAEEAIRAFASAGIRTMRLELKRPFNTALCAPIVPVIMKFASEWMKQPPQIAVYSCATAAMVPAKLRHARKDSAERWAKPVLFTDTILKMYEDGFRVFLEVGPRGLMTSSVEDTLRGRDHAALAMNSIHRRGLLQTHHSMAQLIALGVQHDLATVYQRLGGVKLDFDAKVVLPDRRENEMILSRRFPRMMLLSDEMPLHGDAITSEPQGRGAKASARAAALAERNRRARQFDFGARSPLVSDADIVDQTPGISLEIKKTFNCSEAPFIADFAIGTNQLSYADPNLRGLVLLTIPVAAEIMAEIAAMLAPKRVLVAIENLESRRSVSFERNQLTLHVRAERIASGRSDCAAVKVQMRDDSPDSAYTWPIMEATFVLAKEYPLPRPLTVESLSKPRTVHWSSRDIYPARLCVGRRLRAISSVERWSESGLDYNITVPNCADSVKVTRLPIWEVNPLLFAAVTSGYCLWHSHERFPGAHSFPFRVRRVEFNSPLPRENTSVNCYMRLTGVTPKSHICNIAVSDGDGVSVMNVNGWEELVDHVNIEYRDLVMQPAINFITKSFSEDLIGAEGVDVASAYVTDIPYPTFERDGELWLKTFSHIVLGNVERRDFADRSGSAARRTEWLFGRIVAKEAVRRFLKDRYQARWSYADVTIYPDERGKPRAIGAWNDCLPVKLDIAIAHTAQFIIAIAAANTRVGVDVESISRDLSEEFTEGVFLPEEREIAARATNPSLAIIRFWCAKEAVSKALGVGIRFSPKEMNVVAYAPDDSALTVRLDGDWVRAFPAFKGRNIPVTVRTSHDHALAFCYLPATLFDDEQ